MRRLVLALLLAPVSAFSLFDTLAPRFFRWFTQSEAVKAAHAKHVEGEIAVHMMKGAPWLADAPDAEKKAFARGAAGAAVAQFMKAEQRQIGQWKVDRIIEAAGADFDAALQRDRLLREAAGAPVVVFSFVDCPWCLLAKETLQAMEASPAESAMPAGSLRVFELEDMGREGKRMRAAIALATGRTSMPSIFVGGRCIGGFTDGDPSGDDELCLANSPGLEALAASGELRALVAQAHRHLQRGAAAAAGSPGARQVQSDDSFS